MERPELAVEDAARRAGSMPYAEAFKAVQQLAAEADPALSSILAVEKAFIDTIDIRSKDELTGMIKGGIDESKLYVILARLAMENKILINDDGSMTWIYLGGNTKLQDSINRSVPL